MSGFAQGPGTPAAPPPMARRRHGPRPLLATILVLIVVIVGFSLFSSIWTDKLWFTSIGYSEVFDTLLWTKVGLFGVFGLAMAVVVGGNIVLAYRLRPFIPPRTPDQAGLDRYREVIVPIRRLLLIATMIVLGIFAGASASGHWRTYLLWAHRQPFGSADPYFHKDVGFYVFSLAWLHYLVDFVTAMLIVAVLATALVHYLFGGIRLSGPTRFSGAAQAHVSILLGLILLVKAVGYYLARFDLTSDSGSLITGMSYTRDHAVLPSRNILAAIAVVCALIFFANAVRRTWLLPGVGISLFVLAALLIGAIWPLIVQRFQVDPSVADKEQSYIAQNIRATRTAYGIADTTQTRYDSTATPAKDLDANNPALADTRLIDPQVVSAAFDQEQQVKGYYTVPQVLDVDHYDVHGVQRDMIVAARELHLAGLPDGQQNWINEHTVYTHGYGVIAAFGNQRDAAGQAQNNDGNPIFAEYNLPPQGLLGSYTARIYYGEESPSYSIVGRPKDTKPVELDLPSTKNGNDDATFNTYSGPGVRIGSTFKRLLYAVKFGDANILLSSRVNKDSKILYDRGPKERVEKVAPWLTVDSDALPTVVDGRLVWLLDGYTTSDKYPLSQKRSLSEMVSDALNPRTTFATLPTDEINYMRNAVKAEVDAETGKVTLYAWDTSDPILKAWEAAFPGTVKPRADIPPDLLAHMRYPEDLFKVQREILARYHVTDPRTFYNGSDSWSVAEDPNKTGVRQPPYRLSVTTGKEAPTFSLTSVFTPSKRQNLAAYLAVGSDPTKPASYGKFKILDLPDNTQVPGPSLIANQFNSDATVANKLFALKRSTSDIVYGNLLTVPVGGGLLYVQPVYAIPSEGSGSYPRLRYVMVSFGNRVGIGTTLEDALRSVTATTAPSTGTGSKSGTKPGSGAALPASARQLLQQAEQRFTQADALLKKGDLAGYAEKIKQAQALVQQALQMKGTGAVNPSSSPSSGPSSNPSASPSAKASPKQ